MENLLLRDAFVKREKRFHLLEQGFRLAGFTPQAALLEIGCASGEAAAHLAEQGYRSLTAVDIDETAVERARNRMPGGRFVCADACALPFPEGEFDGVFCEAAFSVIPDKNGAVCSYARVLRLGGRVLLNDFMLRQGNNPERRSVQGIPCLMGVQTMDVYRMLFKAHGFSCVYQREEFSELIRIATSLSKIYGIPPKDVSQFIVSKFGGDAFVNDFFSQAQMSYCQMIFEKRELL